MKNNIKKAEQKITKAAIYLLIVMTAISILFIFDTVLDLDIFATEEGKTAFLILCLIICVIILFCTLVATMLNISRIANAIEEIAEAKKTPSSSTEEDDLDTQAEQKETETEIE